jgi:hypothetical protein
MEPLSHLELHLYLDGGRTAGSLYEDGGDGYGDSVRKNFVFEEDTLKQTREGAFQPEYENYRVTLYGAERATVRIDGGEPVGIGKDGRFTLPEGFSEAVFSR